MPDLLLLHKTSKISHPDKTGGDIMKNNRAWLRMFFLSFSISLLFIIFMTGIFYLSMAEKSGVKEAALSVELPLSSKEDRLFSLTFLGSHWEISRQELKHIVREISSGIEVGQGRFYPERLIFLIPVRYRVRAGIAAQSVRMLWQQVEKFIIR